jgi:hypothetical protein
MAVGCRSAGGTSEAEGPRDPGRAAVGSADGGPSPIFRLAEELVAAEVDLEQCGAVHLRPPFSRHVRSGRWSHRRAERGHVLPTRSANAPGQTSCLNQVRRLGRGLLDRSQADDDVPSAAAAAAASNVRRLAPTVGCAGRRCCQFLAWRKLTGSDVADSVRRLRFADVGARLVRGTVGSHRPSPTDVRQERNWQGDARRRGDRCEAPAAMERREDRCRREPRTGDRDRDRAASATPCSAPRACARRPTTPPACGWRARACRGCSRRRCVPSAP